MSASPTASASAIPMPTDVYKGRYTDIATIQRNMEFTEHRHYNKSSSTWNWMKFARNKQLQERKGRSHFDKERKKQMRG